MLWKQTRVETIVLELIKDVEDWTDIRPVKAFVMDTGEYSKACYYRAVENLSVLGQVERMIGKIRITETGRRRLIADATETRREKETPRLVDVHEYYAPKRTTRRYKKARLAAFARSDGWCVFCGGKRAVDAHHWCYPPAEMLHENHLTPLCRACHDIANGLQKHHRKIRDGDDAD